MAAVPDNVREILRDEVFVHDCGDDGWKLTITRPLDRKEYVAVNKVLEALGGKWNRKEKGHLFTRDPWPLLAGATDDGTYRDPKKDDAYFATPDEIADRLVGYVPDLPPGARFLEPSAGDGAIVRAIARARPLCAIEWVELNPDRPALCLPGVSWVGEDFLEWAAPRAPQYDAVVMNPPFAVPGKPVAWMDHVAAAFRLLRPGGTLVSVVPGGFEFRDDKLHRAMRQFVEDHGYYGGLPDEAFKASGTAIRTCYIVAEAPQVARRPVLPVQMALL